MSAQTHGSRKKLPREKSHGRRGRRVGVPARPTLEAWLPLPVGRSHPGAGICGVRRGTAVQVTCRRSGGSAAGKLSGWRMCATC